MLKKKNLKQNDDIYSTDCTIDSNICNKNKNIKNIKANIDKENKKGISDLKDEKEKKANNSIKKDKEKKEKRKIWTIHGKKYDLSPFIERHPGGKEILERALFMDDCGVMFETYHNFSDKEAIRKSLEKYEIKEEEENQDTSPINKPPQYDFTDYEELTNIVKKDFPDRDSIKADKLWVFKNIVFTIAYLYCLIYGFFILESTLMKISLSFLAGILWIVIGFNVMHDGSHFGISSNPKVNQTLEMIWNSFGLWNSLIWYLHHSYGHHSYTGNTKYDPDLKHYRPFAIKYKTDKSSVFSFTKKYQDKLIFIIAGLFPGMYFGQMLSYLVGAIRGKIWGVRLPKNIISYLKPVEVILGLLKIYILWKGLFAATLSYMLAQNLTYHINIAPDHDTFESSVENKDDNTNNWLKLQISHSGNFCNSNPIWTHFFGGINYQIEHHVFPNMSHVHYPKIKKYVEDFCKKKGYSYNEHNGIFSAYSSFIKNMKYQILKD